MNSSCSILEATCRTVLGFTYENPILRSSLRRVRGLQCFFSFSVMTSAIMRRGQCPLLESVLDRRLAQCLPDDLDLLWPRHAPCPRRLSVRYVLQPTFVHPSKPLPHSRVRPHQQIPYPAYAQVHLPLVACSQDVPCLPRRAGRNHLQEDLCVCIGQEITARRQGTGLAPSRPSEALMCICHGRIDQNLSVWAGVMPQVAKVSGS